MLCDNRSVESSVYISNSRNANINDFYDNKENQLEKMAFHKFRGQARTDFTMCHKPTLPEKCVKSRH